MRRGSLLEGLLFALALACFAYGYGWGRGDGRPPLPGERLEDGLRVMTWNVGRATAKGPRPLADEDLAHVASVLEELRPDLCFLEEVRSARQATELARDLGGGWSAEVSRGRMGRLVAALSRGGELRVEGRAPRGALAVSLRSAAGFRVRATGVHADAFSAERRNELLGAATDALLASSGDAALCILAGDFNLDLDLDKRRDLFSDDAYRDVETYNYVAGLLRDAARGSGATAEPDRRLDYVFVGAGAPIRAAGPLRGLREGEMDHDPLVVDLGPPR